jgi:small nuclear ribonucleoprotein (snRNP)-like protein
MNTKTFMQIMIGKIIKVKFFGLILIIIYSCSQIEHTSSFITADESRIEVKIDEINYNIQSDTIRIRGVIIDSLTLEALLGSEIQIISKDREKIITTTVDFDGNFNLIFKYDASYTIKFSYIPYGSRTYNLKNYIQYYLEY